MNIEERKRIESRGGSVVDGRVNGQLEVSRSFGDIALRKYVRQSCPLQSVDFVFVCVEPALAWMCLSLCMAQRCVVLVNRLSVCDTVICRGHSS